MKEKDDDIMKHQSMARNKEDEATTLMSQLQAKDAELQRTQQSMDSCTEELDNVRENNVSTLSPQWRMTTGTSRSIRKSNTQVKFFRLW